METLKKTSDWAIVIIPPGSWGELGIEKMHGYEARPHIVPLTKKAVVVVCASIMSTSGGVEGLYPGKVSIPNNPKIDCGFRFKAGTDATVLEKRLQQLQEFVEKS